MEEVNEQFTISWELRGKGETFTRVVIGGSSCGHYGVGVGGSCEICSWNRY